MAIVGGISGVFGGEWINGRAAPCVRWNDGAGYTPASRVLTYVLTTRNDKLGAARWAICQLIAHELSPDPAALCPLGPIPPLD